MSNQRLPVAIIEPVGGYGGMNCYDFGLCDGLASAGIDATLYTCDHSFLSPELSFKLRQPFKRIYGKHPALFRAFRYFKGLIISLWDARKNHVLVAHFHFFGMSWLDFLSMLLAKLMGFKIVITAHDVESFAARSHHHPLTRAFRWADRIIAHNRVTYDALTSHQVPSNRIRVIPHGNYVSFIDRETGQLEARSRISVPSAGPMLLFFGQIKKVKGLEILLQALPKVVERFPDLHLVVAGRPWKNNLSPYLTLIKELNLEDQVIFHSSYIPDSEVSNYFNATDLVVLPYHRIYQSGVLLLSLSFGKASIVSDIAGMVEIIQDGENGYVFETDSSKSLADVLIKALSDENQRARVAQAGFYTIVSRHDWKSIGQGLADTYREMLSSSTSSKHQVEINQ